MNRQELELLSNPERYSPLITAQMVDDLGERTLLLGYTVERHTWHVYLENQLIHRLVYTHNDKLVEYANLNKWVPSDLVPNKRAYAESTEYHFAQRVLYQGVDIPFTSFDQERYDRVSGLEFHGLRYAEVGR